MNEKNHDASQNEFNEPMGSEPVNSESEMFSTDAANLSSTESTQSRFIGPYKLLQQIGEGGMGTVWMAEQEGPLRRRVALKLIKSGMVDRQVIARFEAERQALAMMDHQNIAKVLDAGVDDAGSPFCVMELVQGIPITKYCDQNKLTPQERLELFIPVCKAVQHAHQKGIIHRDLKPSNVLVCVYDGDPMPKVIDFGLAKSTQHIQLTEKTLFTEFGKIVGTVQYMSPEQAVLDALDIDTRTDVYSLGVMLYELMAGSTPIDLQTLKKHATLRVLEIIRDTEPPRPSHRLSSSNNDTIQTISLQRRIEPSKLRQILAGDLDWIIMKALEKDRTRRYETASSLAEDILLFLQGDAIRARPPSAAYKAQKFVLQNRLLVSATAAIAISLVIGMASTLWFALAANSARDDSIIQRDRADNEAKEATKQRDRADREATLAKQKAMDAERSAAVAQTAKVGIEESAARINYHLAVARWNEHRAREAIKHLELVPKQYREFEWQLARSEFEGSDLTLYGHQSAVLVSEFSPDGGRIASGDENGM